MDNLDFWSGKASWAVGCVDGVAVAIVVAAAAAVVVVVVVAGCCFVDCELWRGRGLSFF